MRILIIHNFYANFGGEDSIALREKALLEAHGHTVHFYSRRNEELFQGPAWKKAWFPLHALYSRQTVHDITKLADAFEPDIAYTHNIFPLISPSVFHALYKRGIPCLQNVQDFRWLCPNGLFFRKGQVCERCQSGRMWPAVTGHCFRDSYFFSGLYAALLSAHRAVGVFSKMFFLCVSEFSKRKLLEAGVAEDRLFIKPNYYDGSAFTPRYGQGDYALFLGRLSEEKGLDNLLDAAAMRPSIPLVIAGDGPLKHALERDIQQRGLSHIRLAGFVEGNEKRRLIEKAAFMVIPSIWYEHFPVVILESFAAGKPVLASRIGNLEYIIQPHQNGLHFTSDSVSDLADRMEQLWHDRKLCERLGRNARRQIETEYSPDENAARFEQVAQTVQDRFAAAKKVS